MDMIEMKVRPKKWGNSMAVIIPESVVKRAKLRFGRPVEFFIPEKADMRSVWGTLKTRKSAQDLKKEAQGWN